MFFLQYPHLCHKVNRDCWVHLYCPLTRLWVWWLFRRWTSICWASLTPWYPQHSPVLLSRSYGMQQVAHMLLSGTSVNHRIEAEQLQIRGKTENLFLHKVWPIFTKMTVLCGILTYVIQFWFLGWGLKLQCRNKLQEEAESPVNLLQITEHKKWF